jgi:hypothetical protein
MDADDFSAGDFAPGSDQRKRTIMALAVLAVVVIGAAVLMLNGLGGTEAPSDDVNDTDSADTNDSTTEEPAKIVRDLPDDITTDNTLNVALHLRFERSEPTPIVERVATAGSVLQENITVTEARNDTIIYSMTAPDGGQWLNFSGSAPELGYTVEGDSAVRVVSPYDAYIFLEEKAYDVNLDSLLPPTVLGYELMSVDRGEVGGVAAQRGVVEYLEATYGVDDWVAKLDISRYNTTGQAEQEVNREATELQDAGSSDQFEQISIGGTQGYIIDEIGFDIVKWGHGTIVYELRVKDGDPQSAAETVEQVFNDETG